MREDASRLLHPVPQPPAIVLLFALPEEIKPFHKRGKRDVRTACSGAGAANAARSAANFLIAHNDQITGLVICGFTGGLTPGLSPGDLVLADRAQDESGESAIASTLYHADSALLAAAESVRLSEITIRRGLLVTTNRVLTRPDEKRALASQTGAVAVDMETAGAARVAQARGVPWLAVRAVTDSLDDELPFDFNAFAAAGAVDRGRVVRAALTHPWKIPALIRLGQRSSLAARNLATFLDAFLQRL